MINKIKIFFRKIYYYNDVLVWRQIQLHYTIRKVRGDSSKSTELGIRLSRFNLYKLSNKIYENKTNK